MNFQAAFPAFLLLPSKQVLAAGGGGETLPVPSALGTGEEAACLVVVVLSEALPGSLPPLERINL